MTGLRRFSPSCSNSPHAVDGDGDLLTLEIGRTQELTWIIVVNVGHNGLPCCGVSYSRSWRHQVRRRCRRFPWYPNGCKIVSGEPPQRHAPSNRPTPALSGLPPGSRFRLLRWRRLGEEQVLGGEAFCRDVATDQFDALLPLGFGHRRGG